MQDVTEPVQMQLLMNIRWQRCSIVLDRKNVYEQRCVSLLRNYNASVITVDKMLTFLFPLWYLMRSAQWGDELVLINRSHDSVSNWRIIISLPERCPQLKPLTALFQTGHKGLNEYSCDFTEYLTKEITCSVLILYVLWFPLIVGLRCWINPVFL